MEHWTNFFAFHYFFPYITSESDSERRIIEENPEVKKDGDFSFSRSSCYATCIYCYSVIVCVKAFAIYLICIRAGFLEKIFLKEGLAKKEYKNRK